MSLVRNSAATN